MIINPCILQKIRPYINPRLTNPCIQKHSNNETIAHKHVHKAHNKPSKLFKNMCFGGNKNQNEEKLRLKGLLKIKLNSTHV